MFNLVFLFYYFINININIIYARVLPIKSSLFISNNIGNNIEYYPSIGNGYIGQRILTDTIYISGVFNGVDQYNKNVKEIGSSYRARIPAINTLIINDQTVNDYNLDINDGVFYTNIMDSKYNITIYYYAHRIYRNLLVTQIEIDNTNNNDDLNIRLSNINNKASKDFNFTNIECNNNVYSNVTCQMGTTYYCEENAELITVGLIYFNVNNDVITIPKNEKVILYYPGVFGTSIEFGDNNNIMNSINGMFNEYYGDRDNWLMEHVNEWESIWNSGRIDVIGNDTMASYVYASMYYTLLSIRDDWNFGISPGALSTNAYNGNVFWDQSTWMYPPLLMFHPNLAKSCLQYRYNTINGAQINANYSDLNGTLRYPWQSAYKGMEVSPDPWGKYEIHVSADIGYAIKQYYYITKNDTWLRLYGFPILQGISDFWCKRATFNVSGNNLYQWLDVMPPDEYHYPVNNSVYTNNAAINVIQFTIDAANILGESIPDIWVNVSNNGYINFDSEYEYYPEYDGYTIGTEVKQGDVILLGFPWNLNMLTTINRNNLIYYGNSTDINGPAMTWSMFCINWLRLNEPTIADEYFDKSYNIYGSFRIWSETINGGGTKPFITGAGGFLQSFIFGYGGITIESNCLSIKYTYLGSQWEQFNLIGLYYLQNRISIYYYPNLSMDITLTNSYENNSSLKIILSNNEQKSLYSSITITIQEWEQPLYICPL